MAFTAKILSWRFHHLNIVGCLLKRRPTKGGSRAPQDPPPPWAMPLRLGREPFNWADMSCSIRVRIVYESWSRYIVSSIKSSVQKTSSWTHRLLAADRFCKKDENLFCFFPWKCFAVAFSLKALLHFKVFKMVTQGSQRLQPVHFNCKAHKAL